MLFINCKNIYRWRYQWLIWCQNPVWIYQIFQVSNNGTTRKTPQLLSIHPPQSSPVQTRPAHFYPISASHLTKACTYHTSLISGHGAQLKSHRSHSQLLSLPHRTIDRTIDRTAHGGRKFSTQFWPTLLHQKESSVKKHSHYCTQQLKSYSC